MPEKNALKGKLSRRYTMLWEKKLNEWVDKTRSKITLPLRVDLWNGQRLSFGHEMPQVIIRVPNASALSCLFVPSLANLGSAYVDGKIEVEGKAKAIISIGNALADGTLKLEGKFSRIVRSFQHSKENDKQAVQYHYDVSNDFYQLWLDPNLVYSCAYFENGDEDLASAQIKKIDHILKKIRLRAGDTLLDIGCGWGALVMRAAQKYGAKCVGITLSENQAVHARKQVEQAGMGHMIDIRVQDFRDISGRFDRITSVGMFEHVGIANLPGYFSKINSLLADDGMVMNHGITSSDVNNGGSPYGNGEFVEKYVFPRGELPHLSVALRAMQEGGLEVLDVENLRRHYAKTCEIWTDNFESHSDAIKKVVDERKFRIWRVYLAGSAYAFNRDWISIYQVVCVKAGDNPSRFPWSRKYMMDT
jgi:cyclopropane-fatty-acyl-phospholipid synthase